MAWRRPAMTRVDAMVNNEANIKPFLAKNKTRLLPGLKIEQHCLNFKSVVFSYVHFHHHKGDEIEDCKDNVERGTAERMCKQRAEDAAEAPSGQRHRMNCGSVAHSEPFCQQGRQTAEISAIGGLAEQDSDNGQYRTTRDAEKGSKDAERANPVICRFPAYLV